MTNLDALAMLIRTRCISGYSWNLPRDWKDIPETSKDAWRRKAIDEWNARAEAQQ